MASNAIFETLIHIHKAGFSYVYFAFHLSSACYTILSGSNMSTPANKQLRTRKVQGLKLQREALDLMQNRHLYWMRCTHDAETQQIHQEIAELMRKTKDQFNYLLDTLQGTDNEHAA